MTKFDDHPTVKYLRSQSRNEDNISHFLNRDELRSLCLNLGVDDVGFVSIDQPELADQRGVVA
jgi:hypothetical protein